MFWILVDLNLNKLKKCEQVCRRVQIKYLLVGVKVSAVVFCSDSSVLFQSLEFHLLQTRSALLYFRVLQTTWILFWTNSATS